MTNKPSSRQSIDAELTEAEQAYQAAQEAFNSGEYPLAATLCQNSLAIVRRLPSSEQHNQLRVDTILLLLEGTAWRNDLQSPLADLLEEAESAASGRNDGDLQARLRRHRALVLLRSTSRSEAVRTFHEARELAKEAGNTLLEWTIVSELGHILVGEKLEHGLALQHEAHSIYETHLAASHAETPEVQRQLRALQARIGVNEFDLGHYDIAVRWLTEAVSGMQKLAMRDDLPWAMNYLAQVYITIGRFEEAEAILHEAIALQHHLAADAMKSNNLALLGKVYVEWGRVEDAHEPMRQGWDAAQEAWHVGLVSLVRNYYAELLMHPACTQRDLAAAETHLQMNIAETRASAFHRSEIQAHSLYGLLTLMQGKIDEAIEHSSEAVTFLERMGTLPALRTEEILWNHACVLRAAERETEAHLFVERARTLLEQKANSIADAQQRRIFFERVPLHRAIVDAG